ncbi:MAG: glycosyltransferase [Muribaculaceae bacterium]|nr:glycosyltransferase [Muribaculaceae bacterium]
MIPISIVTVVRNDINGIHATIESVKQQTAREQIEYIVIDGASTDGTTELIRNAASDIDILVSEPDSGIYDAMNKGLKFAGGLFVLFLNSGDTLHSPSAVAEIINLMNSDSERNYAMIYGTYCERYADGTLSRPIPCRNPRMIWYGPVACHQSIFYNRETLIELGLSYDTSYKIAADYNLTCQLLKASNYNALKTDIVVADFDVSGISNTNQNLGLKEAGRVRRHVLGWNPLRVALLSVTLRSARLLKKFCRPLYNTLRM